MSRLDQAEVCQDCGRPYLWADGHDCPGPRRAHGTQTARRSL